MHDEKGELMNRPAKVLLGIATTIPLLYILFILFVFRDFEYATIEKLHYLVMAIYAVLLVVYVRDTRNNERVADEKRALWSALVLVGSSAAQLIYFYHYIWHDEEQVN